MIDKINFDTILKNLVETLKNRKNYLTEDGLRYLLFAQLLETHKDLNKYVLELPYTAKNKTDENELNIDGDVLKETKKELDFYYKDENDPIFLEIKFNRKSKSSTTKTSNAGHLFNDFRRLDTIKNKNGRKILVYVFDETMNNYFLAENRSKGIGNEQLRDDIRSLFLAHKNEQMTIRFENGFNSNNAPSNFFKSAAESFTDSFNNLKNQSLTLKVIYTDNFLTEALTGFDVSDGNVKEKNFYIKAFEII